MTNDLTFIMNEKILVFELVLRGALQAEMIFIWLINVD